MKQLRDYQVENAKKAKDILEIFKIVYLAMEVRTGKTVTSFETAKLYGSKKVLFATKKKAIKGIYKDYKDFGYTFELTVINNESLHTITDTDYDLFISDEHHRNGAFPKPNKCTKLIKEKYGHLPMIFLSGTPMPESFCQIYHQFWLSNNTPWRKNINFYKWASDGYVDVKPKYLGYAVVKDYSTMSKTGLEALEMIKSLYFVTYTQEEAGFTAKVNENIVEVDMLPVTHDIISKLKKYNIVKGKEEEIIADTGAKLMSKIHQLCSGTIIFESGNSFILDRSKANFIKERFKNNKIAIFYIFKQELELLKETFEDNLCFDLDEFNNSNKNIALQIVTGREGISLKEADYLVYYNIAFSAVSYWQSRDRLTTMDRLENEVFWIFSKGGIEKKIYQAVMNKKNYTKSVFKKDYGKQVSIKD